MKADRVAGLVICLVGVAGIVATAGVDTIAGQNTLSARFFPYLLTGALAVGGAILLLAPSPQPFGAVVARLLDGRGLAFAVLFVVYATSFRYLDFRLGTTAFVLAAMVVLGERRPLVLLLTPVLVAAVAYLLFRHGFTVLLPTWN